LLTSADGLRLTVEHQHKFTIVQDPFCSWYCLSEYARERDHEELRKEKPVVPGPVGG